MSAIGLTGAHRAWRNGELYNYLHNETTIGSIGQIVWWFDGLTLRLGNWRGRV